MLPFWSKWESTFFDFDRKGKSNGKDLAEKYLGRFRSYFNSGFSFFFPQEAMMLMGLDNWLHASAWYLKSFVVWIIPLLILVFFITFEWPTGAVFQYSDPTVLMVILTLYVTAGISYCFLISACFKKGTLT